MLARETEVVTLVRSSGSIAVAILAGIAAVVLARRAREYVQITIGRAGGEAQARIGRGLGILGILLAATAAIALAFYGLLTLFAE